MALQLLAYIYRIDSPGGTTNIKKAGGAANTFASNQIHCYETTETGGINNIQMNSVIELLPTGLNQPSTKYYSPLTPSQVQTLANA